ERRMIATDTLVVQNNHRRVICFVCILKTRRSAADPGHRSRPGRVVHETYAAYLLPSTGKQTQWQEVMPPTQTGDQKQRTSPSACARRRSLIAALACSGDWNMVPNRPGTSERLKNVSAST